MLARSVFTALWGPAVSKDPYVKFSFKGAKKGDELRSAGSTTRAQLIYVVAKIG